MDDLVEEVLGTLPNEGGDRVRAWVNTLEAATGGSDDPYVSEAFYQLRHPSRARKLRKIEITDDRAVYDILSAVFGFDYLIECKECKTFKRWTDEFFSRSSGHLRRQ